MWVKTTYSPTVVNVLHAGSAIEWEGDMRTFSDLGSHAVLWWRQCLQPPSPTSLLGRWAMQLHGCMGYALPTICLPCCKMKKNPLHRLGVHYVAAVPSLPILALSRAKV